MNTAYQAIIAASDDDRRGLFNAATTRVGTSIQNIEKDFWVCWVLDALFQRLKPGGPRLLFKGGTSLSKGYGLIFRFSEDVDITVFRGDIGAETTCDQLEALGRNKRTARLHEIKTACQLYIKDTLRIELEAIAKKAMEHAGKDPATLSVVLDDSDPDAQSLLVQYPSVAEKSEYVTPTVKIEGGAKSALDPNQMKIITPYIAPDFAGSGNLDVSNVTTIQPERTFLDKVLILHGMTYFYDAKGKLPRKWPHVTPLLRRTSAHECTYRSRRVQERPSRAELRPACPHVLLSQRHGPRRSRARLFSSSSVRQDARLAP